MLDWRYDFARRKDTQPNVNSLLLDSFGSQNCHRHALGEWLLPADLYATPRESVAHLLLTFYSRKPMFLQIVYRR